MLEEGIENLTIEGVTRIADVSPRSSFNYFPTKETANTGTRRAEQSPMEDAMLDALPEDIADAVAAAVVIVLAARGDDPNDEILRAVLIRHLQLLDDSRSQWRTELHAETESVAKLLALRGIASGDRGVTAPTLVAMCVGRYHPGF